MQYLKSHKLKLPTYTIELETHGRKLKNLEHDLIIHLINSFYMNVFKMLVYKLRVSIPMYRRCLLLFYMTGMGNFRFN